MVPQEESMAAVAAESPAVMVLRVGMIAPSLYMGFYCYCFLNR